MDLARQPEPLGEVAAALLLAGRVARGGHQRRGLAQRPKQVALAVGELEAAAAAIGADHSVAATGGAHRGADERGDPEHRAYSGWTHRSMSSETTTTLSSRAPAGRSACRRASAGARRAGERGAVRADGAHPAPGGVGHEDRRPAHRRQPADRLADPVVELGGAHVGVDVGEQLDEHLERLDPGEQRRGPIRRRRR